MLRPNRKIARTEGRATSSDVSVGRLYVSAGFVWKLRGPDLELRLGVGVWDCGQR